MAIKQDDHVWNIVPIKNNDEIPMGAMAVNKIRFLDIRPCIAVVDDHPGTLATLCKQLEPYFEIAPFANGYDLLNATNTHFSGFIIDWRLPDITGTDLVKAIKRTSTAPICVITGEKASRHEIAKLITDTDVHYVVKPIDAMILAAQMSQAISLRARTPKPAIEMTTVNEVL